MKNLSEFPTLKFCTYFFQSKKKPAVEKTVSQEAAEIPTQRKPSFVSSLIIDPGEPGAQKIKAFSQQSIRKSSQSTGGRVIPLIIEGESQLSETLAEKMAPLNIGDASKATESTSEGTASTSISSSSTTTNISQDRVLPIMKRGQFFKDSFFEKVWSDFETAIGDMVSHHGAEKTENEMSKSEAVSQIQEEIEKQIQQKTESSSQMEASKESTKNDESQLNVEHRKFNRLNSYRNLRDWAFEDDNQAATVTKEATCYKVSLT